MVTDDKEEINILDSDFFTSKDSSQKANLSNILSGMLKAEHTVINVNNSGFKINSKLTGLVSSQKQGNSITITNANVQASNILDLERLELKNPQKSRGTALIVGFQNNGVVLEEIVKGQGTQNYFLAQVADQLLVTPNVGDKVIFENLDDENWILSILKFANSTQERFVVLPDNVKVMAKNELEFIAPKIATQAFAIKENAKRKDSSFINENKNVQSYDERIKNKTVKVEIEFYEAQIQKSNVTAISEEHVAEKRLTVDGSSNVNACMVNVKATHNVNIDGRKVNLG